MNTPAEAFRRLREQARRDRRPSHAPPSSRTLAAIDVRERLEARIRPVLDALRESLPELRPLRRTDSGAWVVGLVHPLTAEDRAGRAARPFSRLEFVVEVQPDCGTAAITVRGTTFDRDAPSRRHAFRIEELTDEAVDRVVEEASVDFARRWHAAADGAAERRVEAEA